MDYRKRNEPVTGEVEQSVQPHDDYDNPQYKRQVEPESVGSKRRTDNSNNKTMRHVFSKDFWTWDKVAHLLVCALIVVGVAFADMAVWHRDVAVACTIGGLTALFVGFAKEAYDFFRGTGDGLDGGDLRADAIGVVAGIVIVLLVTLCC